MIEELCNGITVVDRLTYEENQNSKTSVVEKRNGETQWNSGASSFDLFLCTVFLSAIRLPVDNLSINLS